MKRSRKASKSVDRAKARFNLQERSRKHVSSIPIWLAVDAQSGKPRGLLIRSKGRAVAFLSGTSSSDLKLAAAIVADPSSMDHLAIKGNVDDLRQIRLTGPRINLPLYLHRNHMFFLPMLQDGEVEELSGWDGGMFSSCYPAGKPEKVECRFELFAAVHAEDLPTGLVKFRKALGRRDH